VRDPAGEVAGVGAVRVRLRRRRISVRAELLFGERARVRADVAAAGERALASCGLRRSPGLRVRVSPSAVCRPSAADTETVRRPAAAVLETVPEGEA